MSVRSGAAIITAPEVAEAEAVACLRGVGGDREWWYLNPDTGIGHLRVAVTPDEAAALPPGMAEHDAGESGPERARTRAPARPPARGRRRR